MKVARLTVLAAVAVAMGFAGGCGAKTPAASPAPPGPAPIQVRPFSGPIGQTTPILADHVIDLLAKVDREFKAGEREWGLNHPEAARRHFDQAIELLLNAPQGARGEPRLEAAFEQLLDRISAYEVIALRAADGLTEAKSEPAAIDELLNNATFELPKPRATTAETVAADLERTLHDIPITVNERVLAVIELFQGRLREFTQAGLDRGAQYLPTIQRIFREEGVPLDLAFVPLVESAFKSNALSRASAKGMWQFMDGTARDMGLNPFPAGTMMNWFLDERSDFEKSTRAAAQYLKTLNKMFDGDWNFALASYNAGPGRLQGAVRRAKTTDFWKITASTRYLPRETRDYVPMILAAIIIGRNPTMYGFEAGAGAPLAFETVMVPDALSLATIAEWASVTVTDLQALNPELRRTVTPAGPHPLKVPMGTSITIQAKLATTSPEYLKFQFHTVKKGETITTIARKYDITTTVLRNYNDLSGTARVKVRQTLAIPPRPARALPSASAARPTPATTTASTARPAGSGSGPVVYRVRAGDTLHGIARQFDTTVDAIKRLNSLSSDRIAAGDRLTVRR